MGGHSTEHICYDIPDQALCCNTLCTCSDDNGGHPADGCLPDNFVDKSGDSLCTSPVQCSLGASCTSAPTPSTSAPTPSPNTAMRHSY